MNGFHKSIGVGLAVIWSANTFQIFANSKEIPVKFAVPAIANVLLSTGTSGDVILQTQVPPGQVFQTQLKRPHGFLQIVLSDSAINAF